MPDRVVDEYVVGCAAPALRRWVAGYGGYRQAGLAPADHRGLPSPYLTLIITLDEPLVMARHPDPCQPPSRHRTLLGGLHTASALITHQGNQSGVQVSLHPLGARALLGLPAGELASLDVEADDVLGPVATELHERVGAALCWRDRRLAARFAAEVGLPAEHLGRRGEPKRPSHRRPGCGRVGHMTTQPLPSSPAANAPNVWPSLRARDARGLMLGSAGGGDFSLPPGTFGAYVVTDDPDALDERARAAGAEVVKALHETDYGSRDVAFRDPEGNLWSFGTYRGEPRRPS